MYGMFVKCNVYPRIINDFSCGSIMGAKKNKKE